MPDRSLVFHKNQIRVFDRGGLPLGALDNWNVEQPRSYRLNEIEDFTFSMPTQIDDGTRVLTSDVVNNLLLRDRLIYVANHMYGMRGWGGVISNVTYADEKAVVSCIGMASLFHKLEAELIEQDDGYIWTIAARLVSAAQAKQGAHGDLVVGFHHDETPGNYRRNFGHYANEGDILAALQQLGSNNLVEFFPHTRIRPDGTLKVDLRWGGRYVIDHTAVVIKDGVGGSLLPGTSLTFTGVDLVNRARLRGASTDLGRFVDYDSIRGVIKEVTPECELTLDDTDAPNHRRREELGLSVGFGYSQATEQALAQQIQAKYLGYYKAFLYAYHARYGKPFLEGYDWQGPDGNNDKQLTAHYFRAYSRLAYIGKRTVITGSTIDDDVTAIEAQIEDWRFLSTIQPVTHAAASPRTGPTPTGGSSPTRPPGRCTSWTTTSPRRRSGRRSRTPARRCAPSRPTRRARRSSGSSSRRAPRPS
jgi:hypothetical protein